MSATIVTLRARSLALLAVAALLMLSLLGAGCAHTTVQLQPGRYSPKFEPAKLAGYQGRQLFMPSFTNNATNTTTWYYYGETEGRKITYEATPSIQSYLWHSFRSAFNAIGVLVREPEYSSATPWFSPVITQAPAPAKMPELRVELSSVTDRELKFFVTLLSGGEVRLQKDFLVTGPPPQSADLATLERQAYEMVDRAFVAVVSDPQFMAAFLK